MSYRDKLLEEREWRTAAKWKILNKIKNKKTNKSVMQALAVIDDHNKELVKIDRIIKDSIPWG